MGVASLYSLINIRSHCQCSTVNSYLTLWVHLSSFSDFWHYDVILFVLLRASTYALRDWSFIYILSYYAFAFDLIPLLWGISISHTPHHFDFIVHFLLSFCLLTLVLVYCLSRSLYIRQLHFHLLTWMTLTNGNEDDGDCTLTFHPFTCHFHVRLAWRFSINPSLSSLHTLSFFLSCELWSRFHRTVWGADRLSWAAMNFSFIRLYTFSICAFSLVFLFLYWLLEPLMT